MSRCSEICWLFKDALRREFRLTATYNHRGETARDGVPYDVFLVELSNVCFQMEELKWVAVVEVEEGETPTFRECALAISTDFTNTLTIGFERHTEEE